MLKMSLIALFLTLSPLAVAAADPPAPVPKTGQTAIYGTRDDGSLRPGVAWPSPRFVDHGNGTVTDALTGLIWLKNANCFGAKILNDAIAASRSLASGTCGLSDGSIAGDWRLPTIRELESLVDLDRSSPALPDGHPFTGVQSGYYCSSSTLNTDSAYGLYVNFGVIYITGSNSWVWPVRGGQ